MGGEAADALRVVRDIPSLRRVVSDWRRAGHAIGLVPTMGALHAGHLALVHEAVARCDRVVATIFVNPAQFGSNEDFDTYPREEAADLAKLRAAGTHLVFAPEREEVYPDGFATTVEVGRLSEGLCGAHRPEHFRGVATVVTKLLLQSLPDVAYFGEKDYQQLLVIRQLARDLDIPVAIEGVPTWREHDGLALSSRNVNLASEERAIASAIFRVLNDVAAMVAAGEAVERAEAWGLEALREAGLSRVEYLEVRDAETLAPIERLAGPGRVLAAAWLGNTRLIDNVPVRAGR